LTLIIPAGNEAHKDGRQMDTLPFLKEWLIIRIMLFLSKGSDVPTLSHFHPRSLKNSLLLVPLPPLDRKSLHHFIISRPTVLELQEETTQNFLAFNDLQKYKTYRISVSGIKSVSFTSTTSVWNILHFNNIFQAWDACKKVFRQ
jgi:hypothetical protein